MSEETITHDRRADDQWRQRVDVEIGELSKGVTSLTASFAAMESSVSSIFKRIDSLAHSVEWQANNSRPVWGNYLAAGTLLLGIWALWSAGYVRELGEVKTDVDHIQKNRISFADPVQDAAIADLRRELSSQNARFNRELDQVVDRDKTERDLIESKYQAVIDHVEHRLEKLEAAENG